MIHAPNMNIKALLSVVRTAASCGRLSKCYASCSTRNTAILRILILLVPIFLTFQSQAEPIPVSELFADDAGLTHFRNESIEWLPKRADFQPNQITELFPATKMGFLKIQKGVDLDLHPAPRKQYVLVLEGIMEVEAGDGEKRQFEAGSVLLVTDTTGPGHKTRVIGEKSVFLVWVPIP